MTKAKLKSAIEKAVRETDSEAVLELVYSILRGEDGKHKRISKKQYNEELRHSLELAKKGKKISHEAVVRKLSK